MYCQIFNLDKYFNQTQIYYHFFDCLFTLENESKEVLLDKLGIIPSSYRTQRLKENTSRYNIDVLLDYFKYNDVNKDEQLEYEILLSQVYYYSYYKQKEKLIYQLNVINEKIEKHNILKPLLILFRVFINMNLDYQTDYLEDLVNDDVRYLKTFYSKKYFKDDLEYLFLLILYNFGYDEIIKKLDNLSIIYPRLSWLYHYIKAGKAYLAGNDTTALINYEFLLDEFRRTNNLERYFFIVINVSYIYNILGEYHLSYNVTSSVIEYVFSEVRSGNRIRDILLHYLFSNLMLGRYEEIINFVNIIIFDRSCLSPISAAICLIAADMAGKLEQFDDILSMKFDNVNFNIIVEYIKTKDKKILDNIIEFPYYIKIKKLLLA